MNEHRYVFALYETGKKTLGNEPLPRMPIMDKQGTGEGGEMQDY